MSAFKCVRACVCVCVCVCMLGQGQVSNVTCLSSAYGAVTPHQVRLAVKEASGTRRLVGHCRRQALMWGSVRSLAEVCSRLHTLAHRVRQPLSVIIAAKGVVHK